MRTRSVDSLRTCKTFFKVVRAFILTSPMSASVAKEPSIVVVCLSMESMW